MGLISVEHSHFLLLLNERSVVPRGGLAEARVIDAQSNTEVESSFRSVRETGPTCLCHGPRKDGKI